MFPSLLNLMELLTKDKVNNKQQQQQQQQETTTRNNNKKQQERNEQTPDLPRQNRQADYIERHLRRLGGSQQT